MFKKLLITLGTILIIYAVFYFYPTSKNNNMIIGVSFDSGYAEYLGLDPKVVFDKIIKDWNFKYLRLSAHWDAVMPENGEYNFKELDYYFNLAEKNNVKVVLAVGQKTPRWPECHAPAWTKNLSDTYYFPVLNNYIKTVAEHFKNSSALEMMQVENEPFLAFGEKCRPMTSERLDAEVAAARTGNKPILVTDSGELSFWRKTAQAGDWFGTTLYRVVWNKYLGYFTYDWLPANYYRLKLWLNGRGNDNFMVAELQAEPWLPGTGVPDTTLVEQSKSMSVSRLQKNITYARSLGAKRAYLWGAEWWVWAQNQGAGDMSDYIKELSK
ncbi:MAG: hypothetical protein A2538_04560 [Candidatus Magasanikbacteria bacterium RIFOXYD2_FULL_41_14]|uniref:GH10 domain-containing protein n=1 Tax=Candidatus Magasanikbacteria bacterium RIFOXYD2_FULL_41_14 TaxID=1798709 RepID=A0A1F6PG80_9BACT|nr:MAG: hypothetical protein A2538_04560 [Candidatus Magasanikbacteria bacterium RIFOXYD2_FULL_41_14]